MYIMMYKLKIICIESKAKYFNEAVGKKNKTWYDKNMLDLTIDKIL